MIEVGHNPDNLPFREKIKVYSTLASYKLMQALLELRRPRGMRLRYSADQPTGMLWLEARNSEPVRIAKRVLADAGQIRSN